MLLDLPCTSVNLSSSLSGLTPLCAAAKAGDCRGVEMLLKREARVEVCDLSEQAPVHIAAREGH